MKINQEFHNGRSVWVVELRHWMTHGPEYVGRIIGTDEKYGLKLDFCKVLRRNWSRSGKNGTTTFLLEGEGIYKYREPEAGAYKRWEGIGYFELKGGTVTELNEQDVYAKITSESEIAL